MPTFLFQCVTDLLSCCLCFEQGVRGVSGAEGAGPGHGGGPDLPQHRDVTDASPGRCEQRRVSFCHCHHPAASSSPFLHC